MFEAIIICEDVPFLGVERLSVVNEDLRGILSRARSSVRWASMAFAVVEDI